MQIQSSSAIGWLISTFICNREICLQLKPKITI